MSRTVYATQDGLLTLTVDAPDGLIKPPTIELHQPSVGAVVFYDAACFGIAVAAEPEASRG